MPFFVDGAEVKPSTSGFSTIDDGGFSTASEEFEPTEFDIGLDNAEDKEAFLKQTKETNRETIRTSQEQLRLATEGGMEHLTEANEVRDKAFEEAKALSKANRKLLELESGNFTEDTRVQAYKDTVILRKKTAAIKTGRTSYEDPVAEGVFRDVFTDRPVAEVEIESNPFVDPLFAMSVAFSTSMLLEKSTSKILQSLGKAATRSLFAGATDPVIGTIGERVAEKHPIAALPITIAIGLLSGIGEERAVRQVLKIYSKAKISITAKQAKEIVDQVASRVDKMPPTLKEIILKETGAELGTKGKRRSAKASAKVFRRGDILRRTGRMAEAEEGLSKVPKVQRDVDVTTGVLKKEVDKSAVDSADVFHKKTFEFGKGKGRVVEEVLPGEVKASKLFDAVDSFRRGISKQKVKDIDTASPKQIKAIWNDVTHGDKELEDFIKLLSGKEKKELLRSAMKGQIPEWFNFKYKKNIADDLISPEITRDNLDTVKYAGNTRGTQNKIRGLEKTHNVTYDGQTSVGRGLHWSFTDNATGGSFVVDSLDDFGTKLKGAKAGTAITSVADRKAAIMTAMEGGAVFTKEELSPFPDLAKLYDEYVKFRVDKAKVRGDAIKARQAAVNKAAKSEKAPTLSEKERLEDLFNKVSEFKKKDKNIFSKVGDILKEERGSTFKPPRKKPTFKGKDAKATESMFEKTGAKEAEFQKARKFTLSKILKGGNRTTLDVRGNV